MPEANQNPFLKAESATSQEERNENLNPFNKKAESATSQEERNENLNPFAQQKQSQQMAETTSSAASSPLQMPLNDEALLKDLKKSIEGMQENMKNTYDNLSSRHVKGASDDKLVEIEMTATLKLIDVKFDEHAFDDGIKEFKWRLREALSNLFDNMQKTTQEETMRLLQGMEIPDAIRDLNAENKEED